MADLTTYGANAILNGTLVLPATLYVKLHTGAPGQSATANAAGETTRKSFTRSTSTVGTCSNAGAITWTSVASSETWTHFSLWSAATSGNAWMVGQLTTSKTVVAGDDASFAIGELVMTATRTAA